MRSRYSAYALRNVQYIIDSCDESTREGVDVEATREWAERTQWLGLEIISTKDGRERDEQGEVEFIARFRDERGREHSHHERSTFKQRDGCWYYLDGTLQKSPPVKRSTAKVGRNDLCPCGSGKKHKKCCGK